MDENVRPDDMERITTPELAQAFIDEQVAAMREQMGDKKVLLALSGGVDSSVVAALLIKAIGKQLVCVHVNHGLMRKGESEQVIEVFQNQLDANLVVRGRHRPLPGPAGRRGRARRPKRKIIGARVHPRVRGGGPQGGRRGIDFLAQGTIYPDILESGRREGPPQRRRPARGPAVRAGGAASSCCTRTRCASSARRWACPTPWSDRQPFPGPGLGVRCLGAITRDRLEALREADAILREEFAAAGLEARSGSTSPWCPTSRATGVRDGVRAYEWPVVIRAVNTVDAMTAEVPELDWALLKKITDRITARGPRHLPRLLRPDPEACGHDGVGIKPRASSQSTCRAPLVEERPTCHLLAAK